MSRKSILVLVPLLGLLGCEEEKKGPPPDPEFLPPAAEPLAPAPATRGIDLFVTTTLRNGFLDRVQQKQEFAKVGVVYEQLVSEYAINTTGQLAQSRLSKRIDDFYSDDVLGPILTAFDQRIWVVEPMRLDQKWLVDAERGTRNDPATREGFLNFGDPDYREAALERITEAFDGGAYVPTAVVIGSEMERYYQLNPSDWPNFVTFAAEARSAIQAINPAIEVSVGVNWSNFMEEVAPAFIGIPHDAPECETDDACKEGESCRLNFCAPTQTEGEGCETSADCAEGELCVESQCGELNFVAVQNAWRRVLDPLLYDPATATPRVDFYAFSSVPNPDLYSAGAEGIPDTHYAGIPTMFDEEPTRTLPVRWIRIGWPTTGASEQTARFYDRFKQLNGGYTVSLVSWFGFVNASTADCGILKSTGTNGIGADPSICSRGFYTPSGAPTGTLETGFWQ
jgi:hypothetical protein